MLNRKISVKKMFIFLLAATLAMIALFFLHGPYLEPGLEDAISQAVLAQAEPQPGELPAEGHRIIMTEKRGETLTLYGVCSYGCYEQGSDTPSSGSTVVPMRIVVKGTDGDGWEIISYDEPSEKALHTESMEDIFPFLPRTILNLFGEHFADTLTEQMKAESPQG